MIVILAGLFFFAFAAGGDSQVSPYVLDDIWLGPPPPPCTTSPTVRDSLQIDDKGRASDLALRGQWICEHQLFETGERDLFFNFVAEQSDLQAKTIAQSLYEQQRAPSPVRLPIFIRVNGANPKIESIVRASFSDELVNLLGPGSVARLPRAETFGRDAASRSQSPLSELVIDVQRVDASDLLFQISLSYSDGDGTPHRRML